MEYFSVIQSLISYMENRVKTKIDGRELEQVTGFSLPHVRAVFAGGTGVPLAKYFQTRKIANAAFEVLHTDKALMDIALEYGFETYDTFTRAFRRVTGISPRVFRREGRHVGRIKLAAGTYGPGIIAEKPNKSLVSEEEFMMNVSRDNGACILHGVPKVGYRLGQCTPFAACLKACLNYLGQEISYPFLMAVSGAAFRLRWNTTCWDGGNVDIFNICEEPMEAYKRSFISAGRSFRLLERGPGVSKESFIQLIKAEIDQGRPVIALGIIGPPEACIIAGYRDHGQTLLGWNFFQDNPEFAGDVKIDDSGYFISSTWWENPCTIALMAVSEEGKQTTSLKEILAEAISIMSTEQVREYAGGQRAYDAWAQALSDDSQFPQNSVLPLLFERLMCQGDAMDMISEGRHYAAKYLETVAAETEEARTELLAAAQVFREEAKIPEKMSEVLGGWKRGEEQARGLCSPSVRKDLVKLVLEAKQLDMKACTLLKSALGKLQ